MNEEFIVSILEDENDGDFSAGDLSLREAIAQAESGDTVTFDSSLSGGTITLVKEEGELSIDKSITINGLGTNNLSVSGNNSSRVFQIDDGDSNNQINVAIDDLTITNGNTGDGSFPEINGGGIFNQENLTLTEVALVDNDAGNGGAIYNNSYGSLTVINSLFAENSGGTAGAIFNDGGSASVSNTTMTSNGTAGIGAIVNTMGGDFELANSTITNNNAFDAAVSNGEDSTFTVTSTIIAGNSGDIEPERDDIIGTFVSGGNNLVGNTNGGSGFDSSSDLVGTADNPLDPRLGELQDNGGSTQTIALLDGSPAIDAGSNPNNLEFDQRGDGFDRTIDEATDIGAFEVQEEDGGETPTDLVVSILEDENDGDFSAGDLSLREAIAIAESGATITFNSNLSGGTITLIPQELVIDKDLSVLGLGANNLTIDGSVLGGTFPDITRNRVFRVDDGDDSTERNVTIDGLTITGGGFVFSGSGGGILNEENLTVRNSIIADNSTITGSGGGIFNSGNLLLDSSLVSDNSVVFRGAGGGGIASSGTATIINSTIARNSSFTAGGGLSGDFKIINSTITDNSAAFTGDGIFGSAVITSSIVANNNESDLQGNFTSGDNNLIGNGDDTSFSNGVNGDLVGTADAPLDPRLGELQDNGGETQTIALLDGSPAIDAGSNPNDLDFDQRGEGFDRTVGGGTDIGAFEVQEDDGETGIVGSDGDDELIGTEEDDTISGLGGNDTLKGLDFADVLDGGSGDDSLEGGARDDSLIGGAGNDTLDGGNGKDTLDGGIGNDLLDGGASDDELLGQEGNDTLFGSSGRDTLSGGDGNDSIDGGTSDDALFGSSGDDTLIGGNGRDTISGGLGQDLLTGGNSNDTFVLDLASGTDTIADFGRGNDVIGLSEGISYSDLSFNGSDIIVGEQTLATLDGFDTVGLSESDFVVI